MDIVKELRATECDFEPFTPEHAKCKCRTANKAADQIERLREMVNFLIENDPSDYAADAVTVLDVWRKEARDYIAATEDAD